MTDDTPIEDQILIDLFLYRGASASDDKKDYKGWHRWTPVLYPKPYTI